MSILICRTTDEMSDEEIVLHVQFVHPEGLPGLAATSAHMSPGVIQEVRRWHRERHREKKYLNHVHRKGGVR